MRRSFTGSALALLLLAVIGMQETVLGFCYCAHRYFTGACSCEQAPGPAPDDCCDGGCCQHRKKPAPCKNCESTSLGQGDYRWSPPEEPVARFTEVILAPAVPEPVLAPVSAQLTGRFLPSRGSPPGGMPLFLRNAVLRL